MNALYYNGSDGLEWRDDPTPVIQATSDVLVATDVLPFDTAAEALPSAGFKPVFVRDPV
jgi:hypothetical protein